jgi:heparanase 1
LPGFVAKAGPLIDVVTWHYYPQQSARCPVAELRASTEIMLDPGRLDTVSTWAGEVEAEQAGNAPRAEVWLGETGGAQCGGAPGLTDAFVDGFWWIDELGSIARHGEQVCVRQSLSGADYGLIDDDTLEPRPDYWGSLLWRRLMGTVVLDARATGPNRLLRTYAHCTRAGAPGFAGGAVTLVAINLDRTVPSRVRIAGAATTRGAQAYVVTATSLAAKVVSLNGAELHAAADGSPPPLAPAPLSDDQTLVLPPLSYAFVVLPGAGAPVCTLP